MQDLSYEVYGQPQPQGSARSFVTRGGRAVVTSDNSQLRPWRDTVTWAARDALNKHPGRSSFPWTEPVELTLRFWVHRPASARKTVDVYPTSPPDLDKLVRAVGDSLVNAGVLKDDAQICDIVTRKRYAVSPDLRHIYRSGEHWTSPGVSITVHPLEVPG